MGNPRNLKQKEEWKVVPGHRGYEMSSYGRLRVMLKTWSGWESWVLMPCEGVYWVKDGPGWTKVRFESVWRVTWGESCQGAKAE